MVINQANTAELATMMNILPVRIAENPLYCVAVGAGRTLEEPDYRGVLQAA